MSVYLQKTAIFGLYFHAVEVLESEQPLACGDTWSLISAPWQVIRKLRNLFLLQLKHLSGG